MIMKGKPLEPKEVMKTRQVKSSKKKTYTIDIMPSVKVEKRCQHIALLLP